LELAGIPANHPDNLILAIIHQYQMQSQLYEYSPAETISTIKQTIETHRKQYAPHYPDNIEGQLTSLSDCFKIQIKVYFSNDYKLYVPYGDSSSELTFSAQLYFYQSLFDSVVRILPSQPFDDPIPKASKASIKMATWNLRGATDDIKRIMIDDELNEGKLWVIAIQESHLWCAKLSTANYKWILGPQSQRRASRGVGFLIHRNFYSYINQVSFPTPNICLLTFQLPFMLKPFFFINIHKCTDGDINSEIETGI
jgi:hypothetical protein